jgi:hypothetical protein
MKLLPISSTETLWRCRSFKASSEDVLITSYPKSGTTWLQAQVWALINLNGERGGAESLDLSHITDFAPFFEADTSWEDSAEPELKAKYNESHRKLGRRIFNTHLLPSQLPMGDCKIIYVVRSGRDVAWSFFNHLSNQIEDGGDDFGSFDNFLQLWLNGDIPYSKWVDHLKTWKAFIDSPEGDSRVLLLHYEDMKEDLGREMKKISAHLGLENLSESDIEGLVDSLTFSSMKSNLKKYEPVSVRWREGYSFLRKGTVGDSLSHFVDTETGNSTELGLLYDCVMKGELADGVLDPLTRDFIEKLAFL